QFREDLYYRLNVFPISVPPLRERKDDIPSLARYFIQRFAAEENKQVTGLTPDAAELLERFSWPGNVRQLENTIFRAVVLCDSTMLDVCDFPQIATAMGIDARHTRMGQRLADSTLPAPSKSATASVSPSQFAFPALDESGHVRKLEDVEADMI